MTRGWARLLVLALALIFAAPAAAHLTPNSEIRLRFEPGAVRADVLIPVAEYRYATGRPGDDREHLGQYLLERTAATAPDGRRWSVSLDSLRVEAAPGGPDILATITYSPPPGAPDRRLTLLWDAVIRESDSHYALVAVSGDLARGMDHDNELLGSFTAGKTALAIDRAGAGGTSLLTGAMRLGASHILEGHDHLLFLLALLLPAPLMANGGRWGAPRAFSPTLQHLAWIVTAFTLGHSTTLVTAALFDARLPAAPIEAVIALSVLLSAIHAIRPLFAGRERWVAFGFGLIHGLAFATVVAGFGVDAMTRATAVLGFNVGIEFVQLLLVLLLLPALVIGSRTRFYRDVRVGLATFAAVAALVWLAERLSGSTNAAGSLLAAILPPLGGVLVAVSLLLTGLIPLRQRPTTIGQVFKPSGTPAVRP